MCYKKTIISKIKIFIFGLFCKKVGSDRYGNLYYVTKNQDHLGRFRRKIMYKEKPNPNNIPAKWHSWLHYMIDEEPKDSFDNSIKDYKNNEKIGF